MKLLKKITAVIAALLIAVNITVVNIFAVAAAPVAAGGFILFLTALLAAGGHSQLEIDSMSVGQMQSTVVSDFNSGRLTSDTIVTDPFSNENIKAMDYLCYHEFYDFRDNTNAAINDFFSDIFSDTWHDGADYINSYFKPTSTFDFKGNEAFFDFGDTYGGGCEYVIVDVSNPNNVRIKMVDSSKQNITGYAYNKNTGTWNTCGMSWGKGWQTGYKMLDDGTIINSSGQVVHLYGNVQTIEGEDFPTDDEWKYEVGEADGTKVTLDMLNPDGTVTIDGVTYYPADYFDPDKLTDTGKDALISALLAALANTYVKSDDKPIVDDKDITVEVSEELEDFTVSPSIITVFPFCLPFDFVRGMKTLVQKPKVPVFRTELDLTDFCGYNFGKHEIEISLEKWEPAAVVCRWFFILLFIYTLILITPRICKGAG